MIKLLRGKCEEKMKLIDAGSVDLILTDPPYNISKDNWFTTMGRAGIDFGEWDKDADILSYISEAYRVLKKGGSFVVFNSWRNLGIISDEAEDCGFKTKDLIRYIKRNPMPRNRDRRYISDFECAIWFVKPGKKWTFNRLDEKYQRPEFRCSIEKGLHPTRKPLPLKEDLIRIHSNPGETVLDCFMGSGTTGVACKKLKRNFIGIELDDEYFDAALKRVKEEEVEWDVPIQCHLGISGPPAQILFDDFAKYKKLLLNKDYWGHVVVDPDREDE